MSYFAAAVTIQTIGRGLLVKCLLRSLRQYWLSEASVAQRSKRVRKLQKKLRGIARLLSTRNAGASSSPLSKAERKKVATVDEIEWQLDGERRQLAALSWLVSVPQLRQTPSSTTELTVSSGGSRPRRSSPSSVTNVPRGAGPRSGVAVGHLKWCESILPKTQPGATRPSQCGGPRPRHGQPLHCVLCPKNADGRLPQWSLPWKLQRHVQCVHRVELEVVNMCCSVCFQQTGECFDRVWKLEQHLEHTKCGGCPIAGPSSTAPVVPRFFFDHTRRELPQHPRYHSHNHDHDHNHNQQYHDTTPTSSRSRASTSSHYSDDALPGAELDDVASIGSADGDGEFCSGNSSYGDDDSHSVASSGTAVDDDGVSIGYPQRSGSWRDVVARQQQHHHHIMQHQQPVF